MLSRRTRIILAVLVVASLSFVILDLRGGDGPFSSARSAVSSIIGGIQRGAATIFSRLWGRVNGGVPRLISRGRFEN